MKHLSLKARLVLLHTTLMTVVVCIVLAILFSLSSHEILASTQRTLEDRVSEAVDCITYRDGQLEFDSELLELEGGVYLSVYEPNHDLLYGKIPYGFPYELSFQSGELRTVPVEDTRYSMLDLVFTVEGYHEIVVRGIVSIDDAEHNFRYMLRAALFLLPLLVVLCAVCGYFISRRALAPVSRITDTVRRIQREGDLSARVRLGDGRDEVYTLARTFDELLDTIEAGVKREKQFTSDVSHELRTPVSVILMQCDELLGQETLPQELRRELETIRRKALNMSRMIAQLLELSRADQGRAQLELEDLDFSELSEMSVAEAHTIAAQKSIAIEAKIAPGLHLVGDQTLLIRLWGNLMENAIRYGRESGHIWVTVDQLDGCIRMQIRDDGIGIAKEDLPHIWERFYRADRSRTDSGSSGLGLSMVQWIVRAHHGEITAESEPGRGTLFTCLLPLKNKN
ncbi:MAG: sensor histidine kinase [Clostridia bacterium]